MITGHDLISIGYPSGPSFGKALARGRELFAGGMAREAVLATLTAEIPVEEPKLTRRTQADIVHLLQEAVVPANEAEAANIEASRRKMRELLTMPPIVRGAIMPDTCPAGGEEACIPVGGAIVTRGALLPASHSADVCCSMFATFYVGNAEISDQMDSLMSVTRFGVGGRRDHELVHHEILDDDTPFENPFLNGLKSYAVRHIACQGDGNHFAYIGQLSITGEFVDRLQTEGYTDLANRFLPHVGQTLNALVTHHGSRGLGAQLYKRGMQAAIAHTAKVATDIPKNGAWLDYSTPEGQNYWEALQYVGRWTRANHEAIHQRFLAKANVREVAHLFNEHNFIWKREIDGETFFYHGKGSTPAWKDEQGRGRLGIIPLNMGREILLVIGKGNEQFLSFAPHGAGRNLSRTALTKDYRDDEGNLQATKIRKAIERATEGLDIRWFGGVPDISESPLAYKDATAVKAQIDQFGLADVIAEIQPQGCIMAGGSSQQSPRDSESKKAVRTRAHRAERRNVNSGLKNIRSINDIEEGD